MRAFAFVDLKVSISSAVHFRFALVSAPSLGWSVCMAIQDSGRGGSLLSVVLGLAHGWAGKLLLEFAALGVELGASFVCASVSLIYKKLIKFLRIFF